MTHRFVAVLLAQLALLLVVPVLVFQHLDPFLGAPVVVIAWVLALCLGDGYANDGAL